MSERPEFNFNRRPASQCPGEIVDKIRKLLRMERGGAPGEIENALRLARQLADKHNIDLASVDASEQSPFSTLTNKAVRCALKSADDDYASFAISKFFNVDTIFKQHWDDANYEMVMDLVICGTIVDVEIAEYVFNFLRSHFKSSWRRRNKQIKKRRAFVEGIYLGLCSKLRMENECLIEIGSPKHALVLSRKDYVRQLFPKLTTSVVESKNGNKSSAARAAGIGIGLQTNIRQPLAGNATATPLALTEN